jgi:hypothetical protein
VFAAMVNPFRVHFNIIPGRAKDEKIFRIFLTDGSNPARNLIRPMADREEMDIKSAAGCHPLAAFPYLHDPEHVLYCPA